VADAFPGTILILDGHNSGYDGRVIMSHGELSARRPPLEVERQIAGHLRRLQVGRDIMVLDTLGAPIQASLAWCLQSNCFFSIWGASLAKYRWACNRPGFIVTSRWNLTQRADLHIYDLEKFMEHPSELTFVDDNLIQDDSKSILLMDVGPGQPSFFNFDADGERILLSFLSTVRKALEIRYLHSL